MSRKRKRARRRTPARFRRVQPQWWGSDVAALVLAICLFPIGLIFCLMQLATDKRRSSWWLPFAGVIIAGCEFAIVVVLLGL